MIALAFGNAMALDFMERVFAAKSPDTARRACYYAGALTLVIGFSATLLGVAAISSVQNANDPRMVLPILGVTVLPYWMGVFVFIGVLGASMSTANGAMLVISVVLARNVTTCQFLLEMGTDYNHAACVSRVAMEVIVKVGNNQVCMSGVWRR